MGLDLNERIRIFESSLQSFNDSNKFDLIVTNPPYFSGSLKNPDLRKSLTRHNDTLDSSDILKSLAYLLEDRGRLQLILPYAEGSIFIAEAAGYGFYCNDILKIRPLPTSDIRRLILTFSREEVKPTEKFLTIEYGKRKDFYLKF